MDVKLRPGTPGDAAACGRICFDAFAAVAAAHGAPCDFPSVEVATGLVSSLLAHPGIFAVVDLEYLSAVKETIFISRGRCVKAAPPPPSSWRAPPHG